MKARLFLSADLSVPVRGGLAGEPGESDRVGLPPASGRHTRRPGHEVEPLRQERRPDQHLAGAWVLTSSF